MINKLKGSHFGQSNMCNQEEYANETAIWVNHAVDHMWVGSICRAGFCQPDPGGQRFVFESLSWLLLIIEGKAKMRGNQVWLPRIFMGHLP